MSLTEELPIEELSDKERRELRLHFLRKRRAQLRQDLTEIDKQLEVLQESGGNKSVNIKPDVGWVHPTRAIEPMTLREVRVRLGTTRQHMADALGICYETWIRKENGLSSVTKAERYALAWLVEHGEINPLDP